MSKMIDPAKVEAAIAAMSQRISPRAEEPGQGGTTTRAMLAILPAVARWSATEFSRDTPVEETIPALGVATANALASEIDNLDCSIDEKVDLLNLFVRIVLNGTFEIINASDAVRAETSARIPAEECGNA